MVEGPGCCPTSVDDFGYAGLYKDTVKFKRPVAYQTNSTPAKPPCTKMLPCSSKAKPVAVVSGSRI